MVRVHPAVPIDHDTDGPAPPGAPARHGGRQESVGRRISTIAGSLVRRRGSRLLYLNAIGPSGSEATLAIVDYHADVRPHPSR